MYNDYNIGDVIAKRSLLIQYQMVLSHHKEFSNSVEAFVKGVHPDDGTLIHPLDLIEKAENENLLQPLNRLMVEMVIENFQRLYMTDKDMLLYINIHESLVKAGKTTIEWLAKVAETRNIPTNAIAFDITDYQSLSVDEVRSFILVSREAGFYISIDDIGNSYFNMDRILIYNPDIIKINQQYLDRLSDDLAYKERLKRQISHLAHEMGIIVVVTGIELEEDLMKAFKGGAQFFQGYYFGMPKVVADEEINDFLDVSALEERFSPYRVNLEVEETRVVMNKLVMALNRIRDNSKQWTEETSDDAFEYLFYRYPYIQNAWAVDMDGIQVTKGRVNNIGFSQRNARIFKIHDIGYDYSGEEFYRIITMGALDVWITKPYTSLINNELCMGTSSFIELEGGNRYILCLEVNYEMFKKMFVID